MRFPDRRLSHGRQRLTPPAHPAGLPDELEGVLPATGLRPDRLVLEITERVLAGEESPQQLNAVRALGVQLAIDDFGQGQASMSYLKRFKVDILKIDKSFVHGGEVNRNPPSSSR